jgi:hypothetical protein
MIYNIKTFYIPWKGTLYPMEGNNKKGEKYVEIVEIGFGSLFGWSFGDRCWMCSKNGDRRRVE